MKLSEYINLLSKLLEEHGDLDCEDEYGFAIEYPEECEGTIVIATHANSESVESR